MPRILAAGGSAAAGRALLRLHDLEAGAARLRGVAGRVLGRDGGYVTGDLRGDSDRYVAKARGGKRVRWVF
jgi:hypothetical protein